MGQVLCVGAQGFEPAGSPPVNAATCRMPRLAFMSGLCTLLTRRGAQSHQNVHAIPYAAWAESYASDNVYIYDLAKREVLEVQKHPIRDST